MTTAEGAYSYEKFHGAVTKTLRKNADQSLAYAFAVNAVVWSLAVRHGTIKEKDALAIFDEWTKRANTAFVMADDITAAIVQDGAPESGDDAILKRAGGIIAKRLASDGVNLNAMSTGDLLQLAIMLGIEPEL